MRKIFALVMLYLVMILPINSAIVIGSSIYDYSYEFDKGGIKYVVNDKDVYGNQVVGIFNVTFNEGEMDKDSTYELNGVMIPSSSISCFDDYCLIKVNMNAFSSDLSVRLEKTDSQGYKKLMTYDVVKIEYDNGNPVFVELDDEVSIGSGDNLTIKFNSGYTKDISFIKIGDFDSYFLVNDSNVDGNFEVKIPYMYHQDADKLEISLVDEVGNEGRSSIVYVNVDNEAPAVSLGQDDELGFYISNNGLLNKNVEKPNQIKPDFYQTFELSMCVMDDSEIKSVVFDVSSISNTKTINPTCVLDKNFCIEDDSQKCSAKVRLNKELMTYDDGYYGDIIISTCDEHDNCGTLTKSILPSFFNDQAPQEPNKEFDFLGTSSYFTNGNTNNAYFKFDATQKIKSLKVEKTNIGGADEDFVGIYYELKKDNSRSTLDYDYFSFRNFSFNNDCGDFCNLYLFVEDHIGNVNDITLDVSTLVDSTEPVFKMLKVNSKEAKNIYYGDYSKYTFEIYVDEETKLLDNKTSYISFGSSGKIYATYCTGEYCSFEDVDSTHMSALGSDVDDFIMNICDVSGNCLKNTGNVIDNLKFISDKVHPVVDYSTQVLIHSSRSNQPGYSQNILDGDSVAFEINITEPDSKDVTGFVNVTGLCPNEVLDFTCTNVTKEIFNCKTNACTINTNDYGLMTYEARVYDGAQNPTDFHYNISVSSLLSDKEYNCINDYPEKDATNHEVDLPQYLMYNGPPSLHHVFKVKKPRSNGCGDPKHLIVTGIDCDGDDYTPKSSKILPSKILANSDEFEFLLKMSTVALKDDGQLFNESNVSISCKMTASYENDKGVIYPTETVNLNVFYRFVTEASSEDYLDRVGVDVLEKQDQEMIDEIKRVYADKENGDGSAQFWSVVTNLEKMIEYAESWCGLGRTIGQVNVVVGGIGGIMRGIGKNIGGPYGEAMNAIGKVLNKVSGFIGSYITGQIENKKFEGTLVNKEKKVIWGWEGSSLGGIACKLSSCGGDGGLSVGNLIKTSKDDNWCGKVEKVVTSAWMETKNLPQENRDEILAQMEDIPSSGFSRSNFLAGSLCMCIPAVVYNLNKYRQIKCQLGYCLQNMTVPGGSTVGECYGQHEVDKCDWFAGDIINEVMSSLGIDAIFDNIFDMLDNPVAGAVAGLKHGLIAYGDDGIQLSDDDCENPIKKMANDAKSGSGIKNVMSTVKNIGSTNYIQQFTSYGTCLLCRKSEEVAAFCGTTAIILEVTEYVIYIKNSDQTFKEFFWKDGETNSMDWCAALMGADNKLFGDAS